MSHSLSLLLSSSWSPNWGRRHLPRQRLASSGALPSSVASFASLNSPGKQFSSNFPSSRFLGFPLRASNDEEIQPEDSSAAKIDVPDARGLSTLPERFRGLTREAPDRPLRWPWLVALGFAVYTWRAVLWELGNWKTAAAAIGGAVFYLFKLFLALLYRIIGPPITAILWCVDFAVNFSISIYSSIVAATPVPELLWVIVLAAAVMAAAEAASPGSVNSQQHILTAAGVLGYVAVGGALNGLVFWLLVGASFVFSRFVQKRDIVTAVLPPAALLVSIGEPWVRVLTFAAFLGVAVDLKSTSSADVDATGGTAVGVAPPVPLQLVAIAICVHVAAKWLRHRHLTWMIV
ncbi:embryo defective 1923 [Wolffia australiana]